MSLFSLKNMKPGIYIGLAALAALWVTLALPHFLFRWNSKQYNDAFEAANYAQAQSLLPAVRDTDAYRAHMAYQDYMNRAGEREELKRQYLYLAGQHGENPSILALAARAVGCRPSPRLGKAIQLASDDPAVLLVRAEQLLRRGRALKAEPLLEKFPNEDGWKFYNLFQMHRIMGNHEQAVDAIQQGLGQEDLSLRARLGFAAYLSETQETKVQPFSSWSPMEIESQPIVYAYSLVLSNPRIAEQISRLPDRVQYNAEALVILARAALRQNEISSAQLLLRKAGRMNASAPDYLVAKGMLNQRTGNKQGANQYFRKGLDSRFSVNSRAFHSRMGDLLWWEGQMNLAIEHYREAWGDLPDNGALLREYGFTLLTKGETEQAIPYLDRASQIYPKDQLLLKNLAEAYQSLGREKEAMSQWRRLLNVEFDNIPVIDKLARAHVKNGDLVRALSLYNTYKTFYPSKGLPYIKVAELYRQKGDIDRAKSILQMGLNQSAVTEDRELMENYLKQLQ